MPAGPVDLSHFQLRCFVAIVDSGSFAEAGRRLGVSSSVMSKTLSRLEAGHGVKLLYRSTHAVSLTQEGAALLESARAAQRALDDVSRILDLSRTRIGGTVRLTAPVAFLRHCLMPLLPVLRGMSPDIHLDLRASNDLLDLADHGIDVAIRTGGLDAVPGHVQQLWFSCPWVVCASRQYMEGRASPASPSQLVEHALIGFRASDDGLVRAWTFRDPVTGERTRFVPDPVLAFDDGEAGWRAVLKGLGAARAPLFLAADALRDGRVVEWLRPWRDADMPVSILRRETRLTPPRVEHVLSFLRKHPPDLALETRASAAGD